MAITGTGQSDVEVSVGGDASSLNSALDNAMSRLDNFGKAVGVASAALAALGGETIRRSIGAFGDFDAGMQQSIAVMGDVSDAMRQDLEETAREVARTTTRSHEEAADSFYYLASAGLDAAESIEAMPEVAALAEAGQMNMAEATNVATNAMSAFGFEASELNRVSDTMTATITRHNQSMEGMADAMGRVAPTAAGLGFEIEEVSAAIGQLGDVGIQGQRAGTALNTVLSQMSDETGPAATQMEEMGVAVRDSEGEMRPLVGIIRDFEEAGADAGDMARIFGTQGGPAMAALLDQGADSIESNTESIREMEGATQDVADTQRQTFNRQLDIFRSKLHDVGVAIGSGFVGPLNELMPHIGSAVDEVGRWIDSIDDTRLAMGLAGGTVTALGTAIATLVSGPIGLAIAGAGALGLAWSENWLGMRDVTDEALGTIEGLWDTHGDGIIAHAEGAYQDASAALDGAMATAGDAVQSGLEFASDLWEEHEDDILELAGEAYEEASGLVEEGIEVAGEFVEEGLEFAHDLWDEHGEEIETIAGDAFEFVTSEARAVMGGEQTVVSTPLSAAVNAFRDSMDDIEDTVAIAMDELDTITDSFSETMGDQVLGPLSDSESDFRQSMDSMADSSRGAFGAIEDAGSGFSSAFLLETLQPMLESMSELWEIHFGGENGIVANTREALEALMDNVVIPILNAIEAAWDLFGEDLLRATEGAFGTLETTITITLDAILTAVNVILSLITGDWEGAWEHLTGFARRTFENWADWFKNDFANILGGAFGVVTTAIRAPFDALYSWLLEDLVQDLINDPAGWVKDTGVGIFETAFGAITTAIKTAIMVPGALKDALVNLIEGSVDLLLSGGSLAADAASSVADVGGNIAVTVADALVSAPETIAGALVELVTGGAGLLQSGGSLAADAASSLADLGGSIVTSVADAIASAPGNIANALIGQVNDAIQWINDRLPSSIPVPEIGPIGGGTVSTGRLGDLPGTPSSVSAPSFGPWGGGSVSFSAGLDELEGFASGGLAMSPGLAVLAEEGPELVLDAPTTEKAQDSGVTLGDVEDDVRRGVEGADRTDDVVGELRQLRNAMTRLLEDVADAAEGDRRRPEQLDPF